MIQNVTLIGGGVLGAQIGFQSAYRGFHVTFYMRSEGSIERTKPKIERLYHIYKEELTTAKEKGGPISRGLSDDYQNPTPEKLDLLLKKLDEAYANLVYDTDLAASVADADLVIEALAENPTEKIHFYEKLAPVLPAKTIIATNSSTLLPSVLAPSTGRPEKFLALHFANSIWKNNTAEIMGHAGTNPDAYEEVAEFAKDIAMVPLRLHKEQPGYILNSMLVPFLQSAEALLVGGVADVETIDLTWRLATGAPLGPFHILDIVGINTAYNICMNYPDANDEGSLHYRIAKLLKEEYIDKGKLGISTGEGFYKY